MHADVPSKCKPETKGSAMCVAFLFLFCRFCFHALVVALYYCTTVDVPLIFSCPADHVPDWQPRVLLGMVKTRSVDLKNTRTHAHTHTRGGGVGVGVLNSENNGRIRWQPSLIGRLS